MRHRGTAVVAVLVAVLASAPGAAAEPVLGPSLGVDPARGVAGTRVTVAGSCPKEEGLYGAFPSVTSLTVDGVGNFVVTLDAVGMFTGFPVELPADTGPGGVSFSTGCQGETTFRVLPAPTLELAPANAGLGADVVATGTCPSRSTAPTLFLDGRPLGTVPLDDRTGEIGPRTFLVPDDAASGDRVVTTSCGGRATLTVLLPSPTSTVPPAETLVTVPDLKGLTEVEVVDALAGQLVLANPTGAEGTVVGQDPPPGAQVRPGTPVRIELREAAAVEPAAAWSPVVLAGAGAGALLVVAAMAVAAQMALRRRRERRWLCEHVAVEPAAAYLELSDAPRGTASGMDVGLEIRREPARWGTTEVVGGRH